MVAALAERAASESFRIPFRVCISSFCIGLKASLRKRQQKCLAELRSRSIYRIVETAPFPVSMRDPYRQLAIEIVYSSYGLFRPWEKADEALLKHPEPTENRRDPPLI